MRQREHDDADRAPEPVLPIERLGRGAGGGGPRAALRALGRRAAAGSTVGGVRRQRRRGASRPAAARAAGASRGAGGRRGRGLAGVSGAGAAAGADRTETAEPSATRASTAHATRGPRTQSLIERHCALDAARVQPDGHWPGVARLGRRAGQPPSRCGPACPARASDRPRSASAGSRATASRARVEVSHAVGGVCDHAPALARRIRAASRWAPAPVRRGRLVAAGAGQVGQRAGRIARQQLAPDQVRPQPIAWEQPRVLGQQVKREHAVRLAVDGQIAEQRAPQRVARRRRPAPASLANARRRSASVAASVQRAALVRLRGAVVAGCEVDGRRQRLDLRAQRFGQRRVQRQPAQRRAARRPSASAATWARASPRRYSGSSGSSAQVDCSRRAARSGSVAQQRRAPALRVPPARARRPAGRFRAAGTARWRGRAAAGSAAGWPGTAATRARGRAAAAGRRR